uniref:Alpha-amylase n=1 Tax=Bacillus sp. AAH-31 TaxID=1280280 RepID=S6BGD1_9BACI|nr:alpha-amylase [Bacillus sp. AAH-31]
MKKYLSIILSLSFVLSFFVVPFAQNTEAQDYENIVLRGSLAPLDWSSNNHPLTKDESDGTWKSNPIPLPGGQRLEFKYVMDGQWLPGENLVFDIPQTGNYIFIFHPDNQRKVDVILVEADGKVTLLLTVPDNTPSRIVPTIGSSLNNFNYSVTKLSKVESAENQWQIELSGEPGQEFSYLYALGDEQYVEDRDAPRTATFLEDHLVIEDVVESWKAVPIAKNVSHNFNHEPFIPGSQDDVNITVHVDHYGTVDSGAIYFTTDGSSPLGKRGDAANGNVVPLQVTSSSENSDGTIRSVLTGTIPKQPDYTPVKYRIDVWDSQSNDDHSQFADNNSLVPEQATEFAYYVEEFKSPDWAKDAVIYHIFVDRFKDGDPSNNEPVDESLPYAERLKGWMGGDLEGVKQKLDYLEELGVNVIWLSPVFEGPYSHGYHPTDFKQVDPRFGDKELLQSLIEEAHQRDMKVIYDFVPNHSSNRHPFFQDAFNRGKDSPYYYWYTFTNWPYEYKTFYGIDELPQLNNDYPETREYMLYDVVPFWLLELDFDGFRLDYAKGPSYSFWVDFRHAVKKMKPDAFIFGEIWDNRDKINSYAGKLDGALDFPLQSALVDTFAYNHPMSRVANTIRDNLNTYHPEYMMVTFLDNHDLPRFLFQSRGDSAKLKLAATAQFTLPGIPAIYYGTEIGLSQSEDHNQYTDWRDRWFREMMPWDEKQQDLKLKAYYKQLIDLRHREEAFKTGEYNELYVDQDLFVFERKHKNKHFIVIINKGNTTQEVAIDELLNLRRTNGISLQDALNKGKVIKANRQGELKVKSSPASATILRVLGNINK